MAASQKRIRGVQDIRTLSGAIDEVAQTHRRYLRVAFLELERFRRGKERQNAMGRVQHIDTRFREIDAEEAMILEGLNRHKAGEGAGQPSDAAQDCQRTVFKLSY